MGNFIFSAVFEKVDKPVIFSKGIKIELVTIFLVFRLAHREKKGKVSLKASLEALSSPGRK